MRKNRVLLIAVAVGLLLALAWVGYALFQGKYLEAVAVSCLGPALAWFALGADNPDDS